MRRSETRVLTTQTLETEPRFEEILRLEDTQQVPRVLRVQMQLLARDLNDFRRAELTLQVGSAGVWWNREGPSGNPADEIASPWDGGAALQIETGTIGAASRQIWADLRAGEYVLPPCTHARISAARWGIGGEGDMVSARLEVTAEIADGVLTDSTPLMLTASRYASNTHPNLPRVSASVAVPPGAYAWDVGTSYEAAIEAYCGQIYALRDRARGVWAPPYFPLPIVGPQAHRVHVVNLALRDNPPEEGVTVLWRPSVIFFVR